MNRIKAALSRVFGPLAKKFGTEPVFIATLVMASLDAYIKATEQGLAPEDAIIFVVYLAIGTLARQLVWPATKIDAASGAPLVKAEFIPLEPLEPPYLGESPED